MDTKKNYYYEIIDLSHKLSVGYFYAENDSEALFKVSKDNVLYLAKVQDTDHVVVLIDVENDCSTVKSY